MAPENTRHALGLFALAGPSNTAGAAVYPPSHLARVACYGLRREHSRAAAHARPGAERTACVRPAELPGRAAGAPSRDIGVGEWA